MSLNLRNLPEIWEMRAIKAANDNENRAIYDVVYLRVKKSSTRASTTKEKKLTLKHTRI